MASNKRALSDTARRSKPSRRVVSSVKAVSLANNLAPDSVTREPDILDNLSGGEREIFLSKCTEQRYRKGEFLCTQGEMRDQNFLIREGLVRAFYTSAAGREITLGYWSRGSLVGGPNFFDHCSHIWSIQAVRATSILKINVRDFRVLTLQVPAIAGCVIGALCFKLFWFSKLCQMLGTESAATRVAHLLLILADVYGIKHPEGTVLRFNFTHEEIGNMVSATRPWVSVALSKLQKKGILGTGPAHEMVINVPMLKKYLLSSA